MLIQKNLDRLRSEDDQQMYMLAGQLALFIASGGFIGYANLLLEALWQLEVPGGRRAWRREPCAWRRARRKKRATRDSHLLRQILGYSGNKS